MVESSKSRNHPPPEFADNIELMKHLVKYLCDIRLDPDDDSVVLASCNSFENSGFKFALRIGSGGALDMGPERLDESGYYTMNNVSPIPRFLNAGCDAQFHPGTLIDALKKAQVPQFTDFEWLKQYLRDLIDGPKGVSEACVYPSALLSQVFHGMKNNSLRRNMGDIEITNLELIQLLCDAGFRAKNMLVSVLMTQQVGNARQFQFSPDRIDEFKTYTVANVDIECIVSNASNNGKRGCDRVPDNYVQESYINEDIDFEAIRKATNQDITFCQTAFADVIKTYQTPAEIRAEKIIAELERTGKMIKSGFTLDGATSFGHSFRHHLDCYAAERIVVIARSEIARKFFDKTTDDDLVDELVQAIEQAGKMLPQKYILMTPCVTKQFMMSFRNVLHERTTLRRKVMKRSKVAMRFFEAKPKFVDFVASVKLEMETEAQAVNNTHT